MQYRIYPRLPCHLAWQIPFVVFMQAKIPLDGVFFCGGKGFAEYLYYQGFTRVSEKRTPQEYHDVCRANAALPPCVADTLCLHH